MDHEADIATRTLAVVLERPGALALRDVELAQPGPADLLVDIEFSGISTGTERLLWTGRMPAFPGLGYPLVPGYESVGRIARAGAETGMAAGDTVFVPGSTGFNGVRGLFGGASRRVVVPAARVLPLPAGLGEPAVLLALAATARHAIGDGALPELIVGHGVLGRLLARITVALGGAPVVWEPNPARRAGAAEGCTITDPDADERRNYRCIVDASGDSALLDTLVSRLAPGGEIVLAGFYDEPLSFGFVPAFLRELRLRVAAQWQPADLHAVLALVQDGRLSLDGLITHHRTAEQADAAYRTAFGDPACLKMVLDWRHLP